MKLQQTFECGQDLFQTFAAPVNQMAYFCYGAMISLLSVGGYFSAQHYLRDSLQEERFQEVDQLYSNILSVIHEDPKDQKIKLLAKEIENKADWIGSNVQIAALLSDPQTKLLIEKIKVGAKRSLSPPPIRQKKEKNLPVWNSSESTLESQEKDLSLTPYSKAADLLRRVSSWARNQCIASSTPFSKVADQLRRVSDWTKDQCIASSTLLEKVRSILCKQA